MYYTYLIIGDQKEKQKKISGIKMIALTVAFDKTSYSKLINSKYTLGMESDQEILYYIVQPAHLKNAPEGSMLIKMSNLIKQSKWFQDEKICSSFLAVVKLREINEGFYKFIPIYFDENNSQEESDEKIFNALKSINYSNWKENINNKLIPLAQNAFEFIKMINNVEEYKSILENLHL